MREYRIAFFTVDWNYELVESTLHGLKRFVDDHANVNVRIFDCFGKDMDTPRNRSEYSVFRLADLKRYDGVMLQGNQIILESARDELCARVVEAGIPAVSLGCPLEGCTLVKVDDCRAQYDVVSHLILEHGVRSLAYLTGNMHNGCPEGEQRLAGFRQACADNGIDPKDTIVLQGTWRTLDGFNAVKSLLKSGKRLPDAIVCANDEMALGVTEALTEAGYRVPEDVKVTGYDNITSARLSSPRLTTVSIDSEKMAYFAMQVLSDIIDGREKREEVIFRHELILSESCGCYEDNDTGAARKLYYQQTQQLKRFYVMQDRMAEELFNAPDMHELMSAVERNRDIFGCDSLYLCINDYYYDSYERNNWAEDSEQFGASMVVGACGVSRTNPNRQYRGERFITGELLPPALMKQERFLVFYPLFYNTYSIGYAVMNSISLAAKLNLHESIISFLEIAIDNVRKKMLLRQLNEVLDDLYVHDGLTQLFNRFGYERYAEEVFERFMNEEGSAWVLFIDMDDLKVINDRWGHEAGDKAIRLSADTLRKVCGSRDFLMRYGGDEFMVIASGLEENLKERIEEELAHHRTGQDGIPLLGMSIGAVRCEASEQKTLGACIQEADRIMYRIKHERKKERQ